MLPASQDLIQVLRSRAFSDGDSTECARALQLWQQRHQLDPQHLHELMLQFGAQLLHAVRNTTMAPNIASELLTRLLVLGDIEIPPSLYALQETLNRLHEQWQHAASATQTSSNVVNGDSAANEFVHKEMGRILSTMPDLHGHHADQCRYTGRFRPQLVKK